LKPIDKAVLGMVSELPGRNASERKVTSKGVISGDRAYNRQHREVARCPEGDGRARSVRWAAQVRRVRVPDARMRGVISKSGRNSLLAGEHD